MTTNTTYQPHELEKRWYHFWEQSGFFAPQGTGIPYCIMLPPPNVTGTLHMGHGFQMTLMDALIRYHRMCGDNTLWQPGTDHAGIATQMVVERQLQQQGKSRHDLGRNAFIEKVWEWKGKSDGTIKQQMRRLGASPDWTRERFTLDESVCTAVLEVFIKLYEEKLIYRGKRLVNWDPVLLTAVSDLEVVTEELAGNLWHIRYPLANSNEFITVATTRPETLLGDTAVAVHPDDERYQKFIGKHIKLPLTERLIPIIADETVDKEFGSGAVKITPAHDFNDYATGQRHNLPMINVFTPDARMNENAPPQYQGLDRYHARDRVVADLTALGLIEKIESHVLKIPKGDRSGVVIEPYLTDQWFMSMAHLYEPAIEAVRSGELKFVPDHWGKIYTQWLENIEPWCISRQLWWGHRIPAWYDDAGNVYVGRNEAEIRKKHHLSPATPLKQDTDVLDTWFSAALWPFATLGWPEQTPEFKTFYPTSVLVTGFDIIFFWVARMVMLGLHFTGKVPFKEVYMTGLIRDAEGQKMSKSKGNILDPIDLIDGITLEELIKKRTSGLMQPQMAKRIENNTRKEFAQGIPAFGTDALRFTFCALASTGRDIRFDLSRLEGYRNFCNKIWNAARYVLMNTEQHDTGIKNHAIQFTLPDRWIRSKLQAVIQNVHQSFKNYRFDYIAQTLYEFIWNEYCDWYLEFTKPVLLHETDPAILRGTRQTLIQVLETLLRLAHPLLPFLTEEIWQQVRPLAGKEGKSIMLQAYPQYDAALRDLNAEMEVEWLKKMILGIRNIRGEMNISPKKALPLLISKGNANDQRRLQDTRPLLMTLAKLESITVLTTNITLPPSATAIVDELELHVPMTNLIDKEAEISRLQKEIAKHEKELSSINTRLNNETYIQKAPQAVVDKEREKAKELGTALAKLNEQLLRIKSL